MHVFHLARSGLGYTVQARYLFELQLLVGSVMFPSTLLHAHTCACAHAYACTYTHTCKHAHPGTSIFVRAFMDIVNYPSLYLTLTIPTKT